MVIDDLRIQSFKPLIAPAVLIEDFPLTLKGAHKVIEARKIATDIMRQQDKRLLIVVGPCSIHDDKAAREYAAQLCTLQEEFADQLYLIMRVYFEKPRTTLGWKGFIHDPYLDESHQINQGIRLARQLLVDLADMGIPAATEFLDTITPQFISDAISWAAIGARTSESQIHRALASGLSMPVGFKNGTNGNIQVAIDGMISAASTNHFLSVTKQGIPAIIFTTGNDACHIVLRGGKEPNYLSSEIAKVSERLFSEKLTPGIMVDCSHGNSQKNYLNQAHVVTYLSEQIRNKNEAITGIMLESNLVEGRQDLELPNALVYGRSITDACIGLDETKRLLEQLATSVQARSL